MELRRPAGTFAQTLLDVAYIGTRTTGLVSNVNINQSIPGAGAQNPRRPFFPINPNIVNLTYRTNYASAKYHSLQARFEKRLNKGFTASLAYTYSKYMANGTNINGGGNGTPRDSRCTACEWGPLPEDRNHIAASTITGNSPSAKAASSSRPAP